MRRDYPGGELPEVAETLVIIGNIGIIVALIITIREFRSK